MKVHAALVAAMALLSGCAMSTILTIAVERLDDIPTARIPEIDAIAEIPAGTLSTIPHETLVDVAGVSCKRSYRGAAASW